MAHQIRQAKIERLGVLCRYDLRSKQPENIAMALDHPDDGALTVFNLTHAFENLNAVLNSRS
jgi:hypothetical protein